MSRPTLGTAPTAEQLAAVTSPVEGFALISKTARALGTLPGDLCLHRLAYLAEALASTTATEIAKAAGMSLGRVSQLAAKLTRPAVGQES